MKTPDEIWVAVTARGDLVINSRGMKMSDHSRHECYVKKQPQKIVIDMAGALEKITPDMLDAMRDNMIEALTRRCTEMQAALKPFADRVFNDNGDITVSDTHTLTVADYARAQHAFKG